MNELSQENQTMDAHQHENRPFSFRFEIKPAKTFVQAISALCDSKFNPEGLGRIDVDDKNFEITVRKDNVIACLLLKASGMINFSCSNPIKNKLVNLNYIFDELVRAADEDTVTIYLVDGSNELHYMFESSDKEFCVELFEGNDKFDKCPVIHFEWEAIILTEYLREIILFTDKDEKPQRVLWEITNEYASIFIGEKDWRCKYDETKTGGTRGLPPGARIQGEFSMTDTGSLLEASFLAAGFLLCNATDQRGLMLRFNLRELGDLAYIISSVPANSDELQGSQTRLGIEGDAIVCETSKVEPTFITSAASQGSLTAITRPCKESHFFDNFSFKLKPAHKLKLAIAALSESDFNPQGLGRIDVDQNAFNITFRNTNSNVTSKLNLRAPGLINFKCCKPVVGKMVHLTKIYENLIAAADEDTVTISHLDGSDELSFMFGDFPQRRFSVKFLEMKTVIEKFPKIVLFCYTFLPSNDLLQMIPTLVQEKAQIVAVDIGDSFSTVTVGKGNLWKRDYAERTGRNRGTKPGQGCHASFYWPHGDTLMKACLLDTKFLLCCVSNPPKSVMLRFTLRELGDLVYIKEAALMLPYASELEVREVLDAVSSKKLQTMASC